MLSKLTPLLNFEPVGSWPNADNLQMAALNPFQFYMQVAQQWQKTWADAMASWAKANTSSRARSRKKDVATALAIEAMTVQLGATNRKKK